VRPWRGSHGPRFYVERMTFYDFPRGGHRVRSEGSGTTIIRSNSRDLAPGAFLVYSACYAAPMKILLNILLSAFEDAYAWPPGTGLGPCYIRPGALLDSSGGASSKALVISLERTARSMV
jgi:hypothetical protein